MANFKVTSEAGVPTFYLYDDIGPSWMGMVSAEDVVDQLTELGIVPAITLRINSPGGDVDQALAIYNAFRRHSDAVTVHIDGLAASSASLIAMAGHRICMAENAMMMIHNAWTSTQGDAPTHRKAADTLDTFDGNMAAIYSARTGCSLDDVKQMMADETWMDCKACLSKGFADEAAQPLSEVAPVAVARNRFKKTPERYLAPKPKGKHTLAKTCEALWYLAEVARRRLGVR